MRSNNRLTAKILACVLAASVFAGEAGMISVKASEVSVEDGRVENASLMEDYSYEGTTKDSNIDAAEYAIDNSADSSTDNSADSSTDNSADSNAGNSADSNAGNSVESNIENSAEISVEGTGEGSTENGAENVDEGNADVGNAEDAKEGSTEAAEDDFVESTFEDTEGNIEESPAEIEDVHNVLTLSNSEGTLSFDELPDSNDLLESYFNNELGLNSSKKRSAPRKNRLTGNDLKVYEALKEGIDAIAGGQKNNSLITIPMEYFFDNGEVYTAEDLGVSADNFIIKEQIGEDYYRCKLSEAASDALGKIINDRINKAKNALLADCPYELFWFDKTSSDTRYTYYWYIGKDNDNNDAVTYFTEYYDGEEQVRNKAEFNIAFAVAADYRGSDETGEDGENAESTTGSKLTGYPVNTDKIISDTCAVKAAVKNINDIVNEAIDHSEPKAYSDYEKVKFYKDKICEMADYYDSPAGEEAPAYGNIWQLINVFDGDDNTKSVCEGYAKAFKYLIDLTNARDGFECKDISAAVVTGTVSTYTVHSSGSKKVVSTEKHMWNILHMDDDKNYLVDVTSADVSGNDLTFLKGMKGTAAENYSRNYSGNSIEYIYDDNTRNLFEEGELTVSESDYTPVIKAERIVFTDEEIVDGVLNLYEGDTFSVHADVEPENTTNATVTWESSDTDIAEVNESGEIRAFAKNDPEAPDPVITAACQKVSAQFTVHVMPKDSIDEAVIEFSDSTGGTNGTPAGTGEDNNCFVFTGFEMKPEIRVTLGGELLTENVDYSVGYKDNDPEQVDECVTAYVTVTGIGKYKGTAEKEFYIYANMICADPVDPEGRCVYSGSACTPKISLYADKSRKVKLTEGTDYSVRYINNTRAYVLSEGDQGFSTSKAPCAIVTMKGSYSGTKKLYFKIMPADLAAAYYESEDRAADSGSGENDGAAADKKDVIIEVSSVMYNKRKQTPTPTIWYKSKKLKYGTDFTVPEYADSNNKSFFTEAGDKKITIQGKGNYTGTIENIEFKIIDNSSAEVNTIPMSKITVSGISRSYSWTGEKICPAVTLKYGRTVISPDAYEVAYYNNTAAGTATAVISAKKAADDESTEGDSEGESADITEAGKEASKTGEKEIALAGTKTVTFAISGRSMSRVKITGFETKRVFTGSEQLQTAVLTYTLPDKSTAELKEGVDYTAEYINNTQKGTASVKYTGIPENGYTGTVTKKFTITAAAAGDVTDKYHSVTKGRFEAVLVSSFGMNEGEYSYTKGGVRPEVRVTAVEGGENKLLTEGKDYTLKYSDNTAVTKESTRRKPSVTITGKGNYTGKVVKYFAISPKPISTCTVVVNDYITKGSRYYSQAAAVYDGTVKLGSSDYRIEKVELSPWKTKAEVTISGKGGYAESLTVSCDIYKAGNDISKAVFTVWKQQYTGRQVKITSDSQLKNAYIVKGKVKTCLKLGKDYIIVPGSYINNTGKGTAKVTLKGINDYTGYKTVSFTIGDKSILKAWRGFLDALSDL